MLELRPNCEHCNKQLPPASLGRAHLQLRMYVLPQRVLTICCVDVCPNCGGGFVSRPIRPATNWKGDNFLGKYPSSTTFKHRPVNAAAHAALCATLRTVPPEKI